MTNSTFRGLLGSLAVLSLLALGGCKTVDVAGADGKTTNQTTVFGLKLTPKPATADEVGADEDNPGASIPLQASDTTMPIQLDLL